MSKDIGKNPYTGMDMAPSDTGNGEVIKVADLINKPQEGWEQFTPKDTLECADSDLFSVYDELSDINRGGNETVKIEDFINRKPNIVDKKNLLVNDDLINDLTGILNM